MHAADSRAIKHRSHRPNRSLAGEDDVRLAGVYFDALDTLFYNAALERALREVAVELGDRATVTRMKDSIQSVGTTGLWPGDSPDEATRAAKWTEFYSLAIGALPVSPSAAANAASRLAECVVAPQSYSLYPDVSPCLAELSELGVQLGIISNFDNLLYEILELLGVRELFQVVVTSYETGWYKPDPRIFAAAMRRGGLNAHEVVFVGDSWYSDIEGAAAGGLVPIWIDRQLSEKKVEMCVTVTSLMGLTATIPFT